jgi:outer membrane protein assembly factor BamB
MFRATGAADARQEVGAGSVTSPVVVGNSVLFGVAVRAPAPGFSGNADGLYAIDTATGEVSWHTTGATPIRSAPAVLDGIVYAMGGLGARGGATEGNLFAYGAG